MARFRVTTENGHLVILDSKPYTRPVVAFLPNRHKPHGPRCLAEVCVKAMNTEDDKYETKEKDHGKEQTDASQ